MDKIKLFLISLLFIYSTLNAKVTLKAPDSFYSGDSVVFAISASGNNIEFPNITNIATYPIQNGGKSSQTSIINGKRSQSITQRYIFYPTSDVTIPSFNISVDGVIEKTPTKTIKKLKVEKTDSKLYSLDIKTNKTDPYVGEEIKFELIFRYREDLQIAGLDFSKPSFNRFWAKELTAQKPISKNGYIEQKLNYILFAQKSGILNIEPLKIIVNTIDNRYGSYSFFSSGATRSTPIYSNEIKLNVKPLPDGIKLIGDFTIDSTINKDSIDQGEAVSYKLTIKGRGNIDDIDEVKLPISGVTIYENRSKKDFDIVGGNYGGVYQKSYSIVGNNNFTIPAVEIKYFDINSKTIKAIKTKSYNIKVKTKNKKVVSLEVEQPNEKIKTKTVEKEVITTTDNQKLLWFIIGISTGILISFIFIKYKYRSIKVVENRIEKDIKKANSKEQLLKIVIGYIDIDKDLDKIILSLDSKDDLNIKNTKKEIIKIIKDKKLDILF